MPFIVTTKRPTDRGTIAVRGARSRGFSRRAVATLEENPHSNVKDEVARIMLRAGTRSAGPVLGASDSRLPESGGTVGPLPDGTTIQVEATTKQALFDALPMDDQRRLPTWPLPTLAMVIAAFNAAQAGQ
jgi:hypothetical protein